MYINTHLYPAESKCLMLNTHELLSTIYARIIAFLPYAIHIWSFLLFKSFASMYFQMIFFLSKMFCGSVVVDCRITGCTFNFPSETTHKFELKLTRYAIRIITKDCSHTKNHTQIENCTHHVHILYGTHANTNQHSFKCKVTYQKRKIPFTYFLLYTSYFLDIHFSDGSTLRRLHVVVRSHTHNGRWCCVQCILICFRHFSLLFTQLRLFLCIYTHFLLSSSMDFGVSCCFWRKHIKHISTVAFIQLPPSTDTIRIYSQN